MDCRITELGACQLGRLIGSREIDPRDLLDGFLRAIDEFEEAGEVFARITRERAFAEAEAASQRSRSGQRRSLLDGVPISWKDLFDIAGTPTEGGSKLLKGKMATSDAVAVRRATDSGLVCLGKTHMSELAFSGLGLNPSAGTPPCVNDRDAVAGGSSSGAAASVAFGLAAAAIGSDTGGSVRVPAAFNDLVGLKTTLGRIPMTGALPLCRQFDTIGPLTRNVEDAAAVYSILCGSACPQDISGGAIGHLRFMVLENALEGVGDEPMQGFRKAVDSIESAGFSIDWRSVDSVAKALPLSACIYTVEAAAEWIDVITANPDLMFGRVRERFFAGRRFSGIEYAQSWSLLREFREDYLAAVSDFDAVLAPTSPILPPKKDRVLSDGEHYRQTNLMALQNTRIGNLMEVPALTLPTGVPSAGLMLLGKPFAEAELLRICAAAEEAIGCRHE